MLIIIDVVTNIAGITIFTFLLDAKNVPVAPVIIPKTPIIFSKIKLLGADNIAVNPIPIPIMPRHIIATRLIFVFLTKTKIANPIIINTVTIVAIILIKLKGPIYISFSAIADNIIIILINKFHT